MTINEYYDEFSLVREYPNVITLQTEENIYDLINVSDLWITFDSTTALEAWLLGKRHYFIILLFRILIDLQ